MENVRPCGKCEDRPGVDFCSCGDNFCGDCLPKHLDRNRDHRRAGNRKHVDFWSKVTGKVTGAISSIAGSATAARVLNFKKDEAAKWFGLHQRSVGSKQISTIVQTPRLKSLMEESLHFRADSPQTQFPSFVSFVGLTGAGKSLLIRTLMYHSGAGRDFDSLEAPVPGAPDGDAALISTTGEVNLYLDPATFGTAAPLFYVDSEGLDGSEPVAAQHQKDWVKVGKEYEIKAPMDRSTAVKELYPQFLYILSDVVCYVTKDNKSWAQLALRLMGWSKIGAQNTINQYSLPALIIILNASTYSNETWVGSGDQDVVTDAFFRAIDEEIRHNNEFRARAARYGDETMRQLFARSFSSVHAHYVPLEGLGPVGTTGAIHGQTIRLALRIKSDAERVQQQRASAWTRFDTKQMSLVIEYAFVHLAEGSGKPFDFGQCRRQMTIPESIEGSFSEYLARCLDRDLEKGFDAAAAVLGTAILKNRVTVEGNDLVLVPSAVFNQDIRNVCYRAVTNFLNGSLPCAFIDPESGARCVNTRKGHAKGHQNTYGRLLKEGSFVGGQFDASRFLRSIENTVISIMRTVKVDAHSNPRKWRLLVAEHHGRHVGTIRRLGGYPSPSEMRRPHKGCVEKFFDRAFGVEQEPEKYGCLLQTSVCYGCLFGKPEYRLPCRHVICETCLRDSGLGGQHAQQPGTHTLNSCLICGDSETPGWPYRVRLRPELSGLRVLSLDGGGVRGIVELVVLERLESLIGVGLPIAAFFDLIVGTSAGGIIALGLGVQGRSTTDCTSSFRSICSNGFKNKFLTKTIGVQYLARYLYDSIYHSWDIENALKKAFSSQSPTQVFGMENHCRAAVTTTVDTNCWLIANYRRGGTEPYLNSELSVWDAARCTSAAPMYFEPKTHGGNDCRDGGLKSNNPIQIAVNESRKIWGEEASHDLILSVGSGRAENPQKRPVTKFIIPNWLTNLFSTLLSTMNGEAEWHRFMESQQQRVAARSSRLNIKFPGKREPALDDLSQISSMEDTARNYDGFHQNPTESPFAPIRGSAPTDTLKLVAERLRASLFYLQLHSVEPQGAITIFKASIRCRLGPGDDAYWKLLRHTKGFKVKDSFYSTGTLSQSTSMKLDVIFSHQSDDDPIRIDVDFGKPYGVAISGFPSMMKTLVKQHHANTWVEPDS